MNTERAVKGPTNKPSPESPNATKMSEQSLQFLVEEYNTIKDLFMQTEERIQGIFNFYFTLVTTIVGGIVLILQLAPSSLVVPERSRLIICLLLILAAVIGTVYLLSLSARYAHLIRYGRTMDAIRLHLIRELKTPMPSIYDQLLARTKPTPTLLPIYTKPSLTWLAWLLPIGTYQLAMAFLNSFAIAYATWLVLSITRVAFIRLGQSLVAVSIEFLAIFTIYNIYSRLSIRRWISDFGVHFDPQFDHPFRMIR